MAGIDQFIQSVVGDLGISEGAAKTGVGSILSAVKGEADSGDFEQLLSSMPGAEALMAEAKGASVGGGGGLMSSGLGAVGSILGGGSGSALGLLGALEGSGLSSDQLGPFVSKFVEFAKSSAGKALVNKILAKLPDLGKLVG